VSSEAAGLKLKTAHDHVLITGDDLLIEYVDRLNNVLLQVAEINLQNH